MGNENLMDLWILSRLAAAAQDANKGFETYDFALVTNATYNVWLYEICDVYLVRENSTALKSTIPVRTKKRGQHFSGIPQTSLFWK